MENSAVGPELNSSAPILTDLHLPQATPPSAPGRTPLTTRSGAAPLKKAANMSRTHSAKKKVAEAKRVSTLDCILRLRLSLETVLAANCRAMAWFAEKRTALSDKAPTPEQKLENL